MKRISYKTELGNAYVVCEDEWVDKNLEIVREAKGTDITVNDIPAGEENRIVV